MGFSGQEYWRGLPCPPCRDWTLIPYVSCIWGGFFATNATWEAPCVLRQSQRWTVSVHGYIILKVHTSVTSLGNATTMGDITEMDTLWWWLNQSWFPTSPVWAEISDSDWEGWVITPYLFDTKDSITFSPWFLKYPMFCFILFVVSLQTFGLISEYQDFLLNF